MPRQLWHFDAVSLGHIRLRDWTVNQCVFWALRMLRCRSDRCDLVLADANCLCYGDAKSLIDAVTLVNCLEHCDDEHVSQSDQYGIADNDTKPNHVRVAGGVCIRHCDSLANW